MLINPLPLNKSICNVPPDAVKADAIMFYSTSISTSPSKSVITSIISSIFPKPFIVANADIPPIKNLYVDVGIVAVMLVSSFTIAADTISFLTFIFFQILQFPGCTEKHPGNCFHLHLRMRLVLVSGLEVLVSSLDDFRLCFELMLCIHTALNDGAV